MNTQAIEIDSNNEALASSLLDGHLVSFQDEQYEVTTGKNELLLKLYFDKEALVVFYIQVPYAYPIPSTLQTSLKYALEAALKKDDLQIEFINAGIEAQKRDINFRIELSGELGENIVK